MDQLFCPPLAITVPYFELNINGSQIIFESAAIGLKVAAWQRFIGLFLGSSSSEPVPGNSSKFHRNLSIIIIILDKFLKIYYYFFYFFLLYFTLFY